MGGGWRSKGQAPRGVACDGIREWVGSGLGPGGAVGVCQVNVHACITTFCFAEKPLETRNAHDSTTSPREVFSCGP